MEPSVVEEWLRFFPGAGWATVRPGNIIVPQAAVGVWTGSEALISGGEMDTPKGLRPLGDGKSFKF